MSYSKRKFIDSAYEENGMASYTFDLEPEQYEGALRTLDAMMAGWNARGIRLGYPTPSSPDMSDLDEITTVPDSANEAIITNLALRLCPKHGKTPSPMTLTAAKSSLNALAAIFCQPNEMRLPSMPAGAGNKGVAFLPPPEDRIEVGPDSFLTLE